MTYSNISPVTVSNTTEDSLLGVSEGVDYSGIKHWMVYEDAIGYLGGGYISGVCTQSVARTIRIKMGSTTLAEIVFDCADGPFEIAWRIKCSLIAGDVFTLQLFYSGWSKDADGILGHGDEQEITSYINDEGVRCLPAFGITGQNADEGDITAELVTIN